MWSPLGLSAHGYVPMFTGRFDRFGIPRTTQFLCSPYPEHRVWLKKSGPVLLFVIFAFRSLEASQYCWKHLIGVIRCAVIDLCYFLLTSLLWYWWYLSSLRVCCHTLALCSTVQVLSFDLSIYSRLRDSVISCCPVLNTDDYLWNKQQVAEENICT